MAAAPTFDLASLLPGNGGNGSAGITLLGAEATDFAGFSVAGAGDVNGDGFADIIVGARIGDGPGNARDSAGEAYVVFGKADFSGLATIDLGTLNGSNGFTMFGVDVRDYAGTAVAGAGDVNGDGFDDLIIGAPGADGADNTKSFAGEAYVVFGKASFAATPTIDLAALNGVTGFTLHSIDAGDQTGAAVAGAGDVNDDGFGDLIIGAFFGDGIGNGKTNAGETYVVFGKASFASTPAISLASLDGVTGFALMGVDPVDLSGRSASGAGDVNGDGFGDIIVGAYVADGVNNNRANAGDSYVVFGKSSFAGNATIDLSTLDGITGITLVGAQANDNSGRSVAGAGDVNGDGFDDLIIGANNADSISNSESGAGDSYVVFGKASFAGTPTIDLATLNGTTGFTLFGANSQDYSGQSVGAGGDVNGDGFDDLIIGAQRADGPSNSRDRAGDTYVVFGRASFAATSTIELRNLNGTDGFVVFGAELLDYSGIAANGAGDVNGDGFADIIIGAHQADGAGNAEQAAGEAYIVFGKSTVAPDATVLGNGHVIADGSTEPSTADRTDFGSAAVGAAPTTRTYTVRNDGAVSLTLSSLSVPSGFTVIEGLSTSLAPGASDTLTVQLETAVAGTKSGQISFATNDPARNPYNFSITGTVIVVPEITVLGNGLIIADEDAFTGTADGTDFGIALLGGGAIGRVFTVRNDGTAALDLTSLTVPSGYTLIDGLVASLSPGASDTFTIALQTATVGIKTGFVRIGSNDSDETVYDFNILGVVVAPEATVSGNGSSISDGSATPASANGTAFGTIAVSGPALTRAFTVRNEGGATLNLSGLTVPVGFTVVEGLVASLVPGSSDTFTIQLDATTLGTKSGLVSFVTNDSDENPFDFAIEGTVAQLPEVSVTGNSQNIADGDSSPSSTDHTDFAGVQLNGGTVSRTFVVRNDGTAVLSLSALTVPAGYTVTDDLSAQLLPGASDTFTVRLETAVAGTKAGPISFITDDADENPFNFSITGSVGPEVTVLGNGLGVGDGDNSPSQDDHTVFATVFQGDDPVIRTYTVRNDGGSALMLSGLTIPTGFTLLDGLAASLEPGESDTFTLQMETVSTGTISGQIFITSNDTDESPFNFEIRGTVVSRSGFNLAALKPNNGGNGDIGTTLRGVDSYDNSGRSVANAGDINGDGFDDLIIGAFYGDGPGNALKNAGEIYVVFGKSDFNSVPAFELSSLNGGNGFTLFGVEAYDYAGYSVAGAGDVNGDGFDDLIIGASNADGPANTRNKAGETYVVFGKASFASTPTIELATLNGVTGFTLFGIDANDNSGRSVAGAGDVNDDGFDDVLIGASGAAGAGNAGLRNGESYVVFGKSSFVATPTIELATLNGVTGVTLFGVDVSDYSGGSVAGAGDVNGDGFDDLIIGGQGGDGPSNATNFVGESYVVFGKASFTATPTIALGALNGVNGFTLFGVDAGDRSGTAVASAGDINNDGFDDLVIGAPGGDGAGNTQSSAGDAYVVFGKASFPAAVSLVTLNGINGFTVLGVSVNDTTGIAVAGAGDVNGDGFDDVVVGAEAHSPGGKTFLVYGKSSFAATPTIPLASLNGGDGFSLIAIASADKSGYSVAGADLNGDGFSDAIIGGRGALAAYNRNRAGETYVIFGRTTVPQVTTTGNGINIVDGDAIPAAADGTDFGTSVVDAAPNVRTFTVRNDGTDTLALSGLTVPVGYSITEGLSPSLGPGAIDTFTVQLDTLVEGVKSGTISFFTNDGDESQFDFAVTGIVAQLPEVTVLGNGVVIADGDSTPSTSDSTDFGLAALNGPAVIRTFTVRNDGLESLSLSGLTLPAGYSLLEGLSASLAPNASDTFTIQLDTGATGTFGGQISLTTNDPDETIFNFSITGLITVPQISVRANGVGIFDGDTTPSAPDHTLFPTIIQGQTPFSRTYTVSNIGPVPLSLPQVQLPTGFSLAEPLVTSLAPGASDSFTVRLDSVTAGIKAGQIVIENDDPQKSQFNFQIAGEVARLGSIVDLASLLPGNGGDGSEGITLFGPQSDNISGFSVASAGDVNADGFDDIIIGAPNADGDAQSAAGAAYVVFGGPGFAAMPTLDLATLNGSNGFALMGEADGNRSGAAVAGAGDVNGDGFDDLIIGAPGADTPLPNQSYAGESYVIFGKSSFTATPVIHLGSLDGTNGFMLFGVYAGHRSGTSVDGAGDVNGDGFDDLIIGAPYGTPPGTERIGSGVSHVVFGKASFAATPAVDLGTLAVADGVTLFGIDVADHCGFAVAGAGDVNGDGLDDVIIGAHNADGIGNVTVNAGECYVVFGRTSFLAPTIELATLDGDDGFTLFGNRVGDRRGMSIDGDGDVNGDGFDDLIVAGRREVGNTLPVTGDTCVVFGKPSFATTPNITLDTLDGTTGFVFSMDAADYSGRSVAFAGDINDDGFDDLIIGAHEGDGTNIEERQAGESYVIFGKQSFADTPSLGAGALNGTNGFTLFGADAYDRSGLAVAGGGDFNGDGFDDLIIGAYAADAANNARTEAGESYVIFGQALEPQMTVLGNGLSIADGDLSPSTIDSTDFLFVLQGGTPVTRTFTVRNDGTGTLQTSNLAVPTGYTVMEGLSPSIAAGASDTFTVQLDVAVLGTKTGQIAFDTNDSNESAFSFAIGGGVTAREPMIDLGSLLPANGGDGSRGYAAEGIVFQDDAGFSVSSAGDVNGDGFDDVILSAWRADLPGNRADAGAAYVVFGKPDGFDPLISLASLNGANGFELRGVTAGDNTGWSVGTAGDINNDGFDDVIVGAPHAKFAGIDKGAGYVVYGKASGFPAVIELSSLLPENGGDGSVGFVLAGIAVNDFTGTWVGGSGGDINGDGIDDFHISAFQSEVSTRTDTGRTFVVYGRETGFPAKFELASLLTAGGGNGSAGFVVNGIDIRDRSGSSVGINGDVNGDGLDDLVIGAYTAAGAGNPYSGEAYVVFGRASAMPAEFELNSLLPANGGDGSQGFIINGIATNEVAGHEVSIAGDFNGDGFDDVVVSAHRSNNQTGSAYVIYGKAGGFGAVINAADLNGVNGFRLHGLNPLDQTGFPVNWAGDVNGDGYDDLLIGAPTADFTGDAAGAIYLIYGTPTAFSADFQLSSLFASGGGDGSAGIVFLGAMAQDQAGRGAAANAGDVNGDGYDDLIFGAPGLSGPGNGRAFVVFGRDFTDEVTHEGSADVDQLAGSILPDAMIGGRDNDTLAGNGGIDVLRGGEGDDVLAVSDILFHRIHGGSGFDTLRLDGVGLALNLVTVPNNRITAIEAIDLSAPASGNHVLSLSRQDVLDLSDSSNRVIVRGGAGDQVRTAEAWPLMGSTDFEGQTFSRYVIGEAELWVAPQILVALIGADSVPPTLTGLLVESTTWLAGFPIAAGYSVPGGADQLRPLPWIRLDQIHVKFSENVGVAQGDLVLHGVNVPSYAISDFSYDAATFTATWKLAAQIDIDKLLIALSPAIADDAGNLLDGEWSNGADAFPSGDGVAGGDFLFRFNVLPGDSTGNGSVQSTDVIGTRNAQFQSVGSLNYDVMLDVDGNERIQSIDVILTRNRQFTRLPDGEPSLPSAPLSTASTGPTATSSLAAPPQSSVPATPGSGDSFAVLAALFSLSLDKRKEVPAHRVAPWLLGTDHPQDGASNTEF